MTTMLVPYNFRVDIDTTTMSFTEVSGIEVAYEHVIYRHGLSFREGEGITTFHLDAFAPITMNRGVVSQGSPLQLYQWLTKRDLRRVVVHLCDHVGNARLTWTIAQAVPVKLSAPTFKVDGNDVAIETLQLMGKGVTCAYVEA